MSKYLLVALVLLVAVGIWRHKQQRRVPPSAPHRPVSPATPMAMVRCAHCGVHLPQADAVQQHHHHYCCAAHCALGPR
jgi:uncharacterized protein